MDNKLFLILALAALGGLIFWALMPKPQPELREAPTAMNTSPENTMIITLETGEVHIQLLPEVAPKHVERMKTLIAEQAYDGVAFHRVIDGFMAQTGDVEHGKPGGDPRRAGTGGSSYPDLPQEFSKVPFERGTVGMARSQNPNSANSQFFIMFEEGSFLNGQYTVFGQVTKGMDLVDQIKRAVTGSGAVTDPDRMVTVRMGGAE
jgi:cyclophilin family peptidyl-prolyl cis-trans isomerase